VSIDRRPEADPPLSSSIRGGGGVGRGAEAGRAAAAGRLWNEACPLRAG
jgi:hypothetical protein